MQALTIVSVVIHAGDEIRRRVQSRDVAIGAVTVGDTTIQSADVAALRALGQAFLATADELAAVVTVAS